MPYSIFLALFLAFVCPSNNHGARSHNNTNTTSFATDTTTLSGGENGHIHP